MRKGDRRTSDRCFCSMAGQTRLVAGTRLRIISIGMVGGRSHLICVARAPRGSSLWTRIGAGVAIAKDAIDLADELGLGRFAVVGHGGQGCIHARGTFSGTDHFRHGARSCIPARRSLQDSFIRSGKMLLVSVVHVRGGWGSSLFRAVFHQPKVAPVL